MEILSATDWTPSGDTLSSYGTPLTGEPPRRITDPTKLKVGSGGNGLDPRSWVPTPPIEKPSCLDVGAGLSCPRMPPPASIISKETTGIIKRPCVLIMNHPPSFTLEKSARLLKAPINVSGQNDSHERDACNAEEDEK